MRSTASPHLIVLAKAPAPARSKTRLCPPCTPRQAAAIAEASLADTLAAAAQVGGACPILVLDGDPGGWLPAGMPVLAQRGEGLDQRLAAAFEDVGGPALLIGMDTPQVTPSLLARCLATLATPGVSAVLGAAPDGGFWAVGLHSPDGCAFVGLPMSTGDTCRAQRTRLNSLGLVVADLPVLADVDVWQDAISLPVLAGSRFASAVAAVRLQLAREGRDPCLPASAARRSVPAR
ncbi:MAG: DUF2064 domain-containing protein [Actinomycetota bacterium]